MNNYDYKISDSVIAKEYLLQVLKCKYNQITIKPSPLGMLSVEYTNDSNDKHSVSIIIDDNDRDLSIDAFSKKMGWIF